MQSYQEGITVCSHIRRVPLYAVCVCMGMYVQEFISILLIVAMLYEHKCALISVCVFVFISDIKKEAFLGFYDHYLSTASRLAAKLDGQVMLVRPNLFACPNSLIVCMCIS